MVGDETGHIGTRAAVAAGAMIFDDGDRIMMVRPTYKDYWDVPGGYVEEGESPAPRAYENYTRSWA